MASVPSKKILHWANLCFTARAIAQPCKRTTGEEFQEVTDKKFATLQVHENEISLRTWSGGTAHAHLRENTEDSPSYEPQIWVTRTIASQLAYQWKPYLLFSKSL